MNGVTFHPVIPWPWLLLLLLAAAGAIAWSFRAAIKSRRSLVFLAILRTLGFGCLVLLLIQPQRRSETATAIRPALAVLIDASQSMAEKVDEKQVPRSERVKEWLKSAGRDSAEKDFELRLFSFSRALTDLSAENPAINFDGDASNLFSALDQVQQRFRGQPLAAVLVLSDGLDTTGGARSTAAKAGVPIDTFELERPYQAAIAATDLSIASLDFPPRVVTGWDTNIRAEIAGRGMAGQTIAVELWREDEKVGDSLVSFNAQDQRRQISIPVTHSKAGTVKYELRVNDPSGKMAKNRQFVIDVLEPGNRVLYVQNTLGFDFKFLRKAIKADRNLQVSSYVRWGDGKIVSLDESEASAVRALEFTKDSLAQNSVVILGDLAPESLNAEAWTAVREFVDGGGALVLLGGPNFFPSPGIASTPIAEMLPVTTPAEYKEGEFALQITETGMRHPVFGPLFAEVKEFPPLLTSNLSPGVAPTAELLMETITDGASHPVVVSTRFGKGRVVAVLSDTIWRWRLAAKGWSTDRSPYDTFWAQLMDYLIPKQEEKEGGGKIELVTERTGYLLGEKPEVRAIVRTQGKPPATLPLQIRTPDGKSFDYIMQPATFRLTTGRQVEGFRAEVEPNVAGVFEGHTSATIEGVKVDADLRFVVNQPVTERMGTPIDRDLLQSIANDSGGHFYAINEWKNWRKDLRYEQQFITKAEMSDLWTNPWVTALLLGFLALEWAARKYQNLP